MHFLSADRRHIVAQPVLLFQNRVGRNLGE